MDAFTSKIFDLDEIDMHDDVELELVRHFTHHCASIKDKSEIELHNYLQEKASQSKKDYIETVSALLYGILTEPEHAQSHFHSLSLVNRDHFATVIVKLQYFANNIKFQSFNSRTIDQILWLSSELTTLNIQNIDSIYLSLLRQIRCGDLSQQNTSFCYQMLKLCDTHKQWLHIYPRVLATAVFTYLRLIADHRSSQLTSLQQREIKFVITLMREKWVVCCSIGRDLVRLLQDVSSIPDFAQLWKDILTEPHKLSHNFKGITVLLQTPTPREFLRSRLSPDMEYKLLYILQNLRINHYQRNLGWFVQRFMSGSESFYVDVIRFIVAGWYPNNQILQSDIVPRYVVIGSMLRAIKSPVVAANVKVALVFDWLFFTANDNIMFIEPSMLLMERSAERYPYITAIIMEFLKYAVEEYFPPLREYMANCVSCGMRTMLEKGVIRSLTPIYNCPSIDDATREVIRTLFGEFVAKNTLPTYSVNDSPQLPPALSIPVPLEHPASHAITPGSPRSCLSKLPQTSDVVDDANGSVAEDTKTIDTNHNQTWDVDDVDRYLYGEQGPVSAAQQDGVHEIKGMDDDAVMFDEAPPSPEVPNALNVDDHQSDVGITNEEHSFGKKVVSAQWYLVFGDSLSKFKAACATFATDTTTYDCMSMGAAKESLDEVIKVYLRMSITGHTLASVIATEIHEVTLHSLSHASTTVVKRTTESVIHDNTQDILDLLMSYLWKAINSESPHDCKKMVDLIGRIAQNIRGNDGHLIGMRWWYYFARQAQINDQSLTQAGWMSEVVNAYKPYASLAYGASRMQIAKALTEDIQILAEQSFEAFYTILPLLYRYIPSYTVGNMELLNLLAAIAIPEQVGKMVALVQSDAIHFFGDEIDAQFLVASFHLDPYETVFVWQILSTELQGQQELIESLFQTPEAISIFHDNGLRTVTPQILSLLATAKPTSVLLNAMCGLIPPPGAKYQYDNFQLLIGAVNYWTRRHGSQSTKECVDHLLKALEQTSDTTIRELQSTILQ